jgi:zinc protease
MAKASTAPVTAYAVEAVKAWPYANFGPAGKIVERREIEDLGITFVRFENGVRLSVKPFTAQKDQITVQVRLGLGRLGMPRDRIDASDMGALLWSRGGLNKLTRTEQARTLAGKRVLAAARTNDDAYVIDNAGITTATDFGTQMELMAAMVADPAFRADDWDTLMADSDRTEAATPFSAASVLQFNLERLLHSDDLRWTYNTAEMRRGWKPEDAVAYIRPIVAESPIELIVVGDIDVERAIADTARTFGALPPRPEKPEPPGLRDVKFPLPGDGPVVLTHKGRADQGFALVAWPTQGMFENVRDARIGFVLGQMLRDQATRELRSGSGATYSPDSDIEFSRDLPGYGYIGVMVEVPPEMIDGVLAQMQRIATDLGAGVMPASEVRRIVQPRLEQARRERSSSVGYWLRNMAGAQTDPKGLDLIRSEAADYESITVADVQAAARRWLRPETAWKLKVVPEAAEN